MSSELTDDPLPAVVAGAGLALDRCLAAPPTLGRGRLLCVDGPAGSGKTTLADLVLTRAHRRVASVALLHMDDLYEGWRGLGDVASRIHRDLLVPLSQGGSPHYRRWDWRAAAWAERHEVDPVALLVLEGVGSGASAYADLIGTLVWVEAPVDLRLERGLARDGEAMRSRWKGWMADEAALFARDRTRERADVVVDTGAAAG